MGASPTAPTQQNRLIYSITWPYVELAADQVGGDIHALAKVIIKNEGDGSQVSPFLTILANRILVATRSVDRGENFTAFLNLADEQNPSGVTVTVGTNTSFTNLATAVCGRLAFYNPAGVEAMATRVTITLNSTLTSHFNGTFRVFARMFQNGGSAGDFKTRLKVSINSTNWNIYQSDSKPTTITALTTANQYELIDYGSVTLPPNLGGLKSGESYSSYIFELQASNDNATPPDLYLMDLVLLPTDEFSAEMIGDIESGGTDTFLFYNRQLELDSATRPKETLSALLSDSSSGNLLTRYEAIATQPFGLQRAKQQRVYFLSDNSLQGYTWVSSAFSILLNRLNRYASMRGAEA